MLYMVAWFEQARFSSIYRFTYFDIGAEGQNSDWGVYGNCSLSSALEDKRLHIPSEKALPQSNKTLPHVILGDEAFSLTSCTLSLASTPIDKHRSITTGIAEPDV